MATCQADADCAALEICAVIPESSSGVCTSQCIDACPRGMGLQLFDGCHCPNMPTGTTMCSNGAEFVSCDTIGQESEWYGQDGHYPSDALSYTDNGDGTIRDELSGLVWATTPAAELSWSEANEYCLGGAGGLPGEGWRIPTVPELVSVVVFPGMTPDAVFDAPVSITWASTGNTVSTGPSDHGSHVRLGNAGAFIMTVGDEEQHQALCVLDPNAETTNQRQASVETLEGLFVNRATGLYWSGAPDCEACSFTQSIAECDQKPGEWRLPDFKELVSASVDKADAWPSTVLSADAVYYMVDNRHSTKSYIAGKTYDARCVAGLSGAGPDGDPDGDGVLSDGDASGASEDSPCAAGATVACDDNCPDAANADQADADGDGVGNVCDASFDAITPGFVFIPPGSFWMGSPAEGESCPDGYKGGGCSGEAVGTTTGEAGRV